MSRRLPTASLTSLVACLGALACGREPPEWVDLSATELREALDPEASSDQRRQFRRADGARLSFVNHEGRRWVEVTLDGTRMVRHPPVPGLWRIGVGIRGRHGAAGEPARHRLTAGARQFTLQPEWDPRSPADLHEGHFSVSRTPFDTAKRLATLWLRLPAEAQPPDRLVLALEADSSIVGDRERAYGRRFAADGIALTPGESVTVSVDADSSDALRFATALEPATTAAPAARQGVMFRVSQNGRTLFEHIEPSANRERFAWHSVPVLDAGPGPIRLTFSVDGDPAHAAFAIPTLGPREIGRPGNRPWADARPDLIVFLADTLRADALASYGGSLALTPNLDALAARAQVFRRAWSVSTYTMPAHASMFSGYFPLESGALSSGHALPAAVRTLAEILRDAGYRTGAITDSVVVSSRAGLDQGFQWFDELQQDLDSTFERARAFLEADDGRPVFLFVHTYRAHTPYRVSERTRSERGEELGIESDYVGVAGEVARLKQGSPAVDRDELGRAVERLQALYRGGVVDLDRGFAGFLETIESRGWLDRGLLVFTSDHGEAFFEHGDLYHAGRVWEEQTRVPLLLVGHRVQPGVSERSASLVDLAPTLLDAAGLETPSDWAGSSLLHDAPDPTVLLFQSQAVPDSTFAIVEGPQKVIGYADPQAIRDGRIHGAFDLAADPGEQTPISPEDAPWVHELLDRHGPRVETALEPRFGTARGDVDPERIEQLRAMGYLLDEAGDSPE